MNQHALTSDPREEYMTKWSRTARRGLFFGDPSYLQTDKKKEDGRSNNNLSEKLIMRSHKARMLQKTNTTLLWQRVGDCAQYVNRQLILKWRLNK